MVRIPRKTALIALFFFSLVNAGEAIRIDASSAASAEMSWRQMLAAASAQDQQKLQVALIQLNLAGVNSAYDVASNPELQNPSVIRVKDKLAGLTAEEIIELANKTSTVKVKVNSQ